jgi:AcrR family transcriptional regulator
MAGYPRKRARTRAALVRGAMEVMARGGTDAVTVAAVTTAAGVSHGTLYNHVEGLDELTGLVADELAAVLQRGADELAEASSDPATRVALGTGQLLSMPRTDPVFAAAFVAAMADHGPFARRVRALVERTVGHGIRCGDFVVPDQQAAVDAIVGTVVQTLRSAVLDGRAIDGAATAELCLRLLDTDTDTRAAALAASVDVLAAA